jgi:hypothetical protein
MPVICIRVKDFFIISLIVIKDDFSEMSLGPKCVGHSHLNKKMVDICLSVTIACY